MMKSSNASRFASSRGTDGGGVVHHQATTASGGGRRPAAAAPGRGGGDQTPAASKSNLPNKSVSAVGAADNNNNSNSRRQAVAKNFLLHNSVPMQSRQQQIQRQRQEQTKRSQAEKHAKSTDSIGQSDRSMTTAAAEDGHLNVEEILWSRQIARTEIHAGNMMAPQRLRDMLERDVQLRAQKRPRPFLENSSGIGRSRSAKPGQAELMDWYNRDCLLIHRKWADLSADANASQRGINRAKLAAELPRHTFECESTSVAPGPVATRTRAQSIASSNGGCAVNGGAAGGSLGSTNSTHSRRERTPATTEAAGPDMELCCETVGEQKLDEWRETARRKTRGELLANLAAPGPLDGLELDEQQNATQPCWNGQRRLSVKFTRLSLLPPLENVFASVALYDVRMRQKLSEDFHLNSGSFTTTIGKCGDGGYAKRALFKLPEEEGGGSGAGDGLVLVFRLEKALQQGGLDAALEVYTKKQPQQQEGHENVSQFIKTSAGQKQPRFRQQIGLVALPIVRTVENAFSGTEQHRSDLRRTTGGGGPPRSFTDSFIQAYQQNSEKQLQQQLHGNDPQSDTLSECSSSADRFSCSAVPIRTSNSWSLLAGHKFSIEDPSALPPSKPAPSAQQNQQQQQLRSHRWSRHLIGCPLSVRVSHFLKSEPLAESELFDWLQALLGTGSGQQQRQGNRSSEKIPLDMRLELEICQLEEVAREGWRIVSPECRLLNFHGIQNGAGEEQGGGGEREEWMELLEGTPLLAQDILPFPVSPRLISPNSFARHLLFLYPRFVNFSSRTGQNARNICVHVELLDAQMRRLDAFFADDGNCLVGSVHSPVQYHSKQPQFGGVEWKLLLPTDPPEGLHLRFKFVHVSCRPRESGAGTAAKSAAAAAMPGQTETPIGFSWLPLHPAADAHLPTGDQHLPISLDPLPPAICFLSPQLAFPNVHWLDGHRPLFHLSLQLVSSIQPQDPHLCTFLRLSSQWSAITATANDFSSSSPPPPTIVVDELTQAVRNLLKIRPEPMLAFLHILLHRILAILHTTNGGGNGTETEESAAALAQCCFDILCQLAKIATMLLDANADTWGRSRILLDFVREQALPAEEVGRQTAAAADVNGNVKTEEEETKNKMPLMGTGRIGVEKGRGEKLLLANGGAEDMLNNNNSKGMDGTATKKTKQQQPLHEQLARLFLCSQGTARDTACTFCWFPLSLIHRSMAEHLVRTEGQLLPRHMRFSAPFVAHLAQLGELLGDELFDRLPKNHAQTQAISHAWAKFLRGSISLMSRSLVLRLFKRHCQLMGTRIETLQLVNPALADQLLSLKLAFIRTLYSHEHFLFLCLPFADLPTPVPAAAVEPQKGATADESMKRSMTNLSTMASRRTPQQHNNNNSNGSSSSSNIGNLGNRMMNKMPALNKSPSTTSPQLFGHPSAEHAHKHFPISLLLSQLHSLLIANNSNNSNTPSLSPSLPACIDLLHWLIAAHESDWRLKDPELRQRLALIYSPLLSIVLELMNTGGGRGREGGWLFPIVGTVGGTATTAFLDRSDADSGLASEEGGSNGTTAAAAATGNNNEKANGGVAGDEQMRLALGRKLLLCLCWLLRSLHQPTLLQHIRQQFSPNQMSQFVLLLRSLVSMFAQQPPPQQRSARRNSADSFVQLNMLHIGPVPADELHLLLSSSTTATGASTCPPPAAASAPATSSASSKARLGRHQSVETNLSERGGSDRQTAKAMAAMEERSSHKGFLLMAEEEEESTATTAVRWRRKPAVAGGQEAAAHERAISRHLSTEVLLLVLDQFELLLQLAPCCSPALLLPEMARLLLHILAGHNSLAAQEHIFRSQRAFVRKFPDFLLDCQQGGASGAEQQQQSQLLLSGLCLQLLRHMGSELTETRAQAGISAFALLRASQRLHKGAFVRLGKTFTMALSSLVSNAAASGLALNDAILRQSLEAILQLRDGTEARKESAVWRAQLEELVANLGAILSDTLKLGACGDDVEMAVDLMQRIARGYRTNPELRIAWLMAIARKHLEEGRRNYAEAAQCLLHCCAILADQLASSGAVDDELLPHSVFQTFEELMGDNVREEWTQQGRAGRSAERVEQQQQPAAGLGMQQQQFSLSAFAEMVEKTAKLFERAQLFELVPTLFKLVFPMHERQHAHAKLIQLHAQIVSCLSRVEPPLLLALEEEDWPATGTGNCSADKRCFGTYFRVRFFGPRFGELDGQEFVYKEPAITKLSEISHRLEEFYAAKFGLEALVMIKDSNEVDVKSLDPGRAYIQITYVEPHFERWEQKRRRTHLQRSYRLRQFLYATPFTQQAGRAHGRLKEQFKRKTVLTLENSFPYVKTRLRVIRREQSVLAPIEVAIEDVQKRSRELAWAMAARPVDAKMLQMHLQGCIGTTVNQGPLEIARVFLAGASLDASGLPRDGAQRRLRLCFAELGRRCADALEMNARLMDPSREDYQLELCRNLNHFDQSMAMLSNHAPPQPSSLPAPPQSAAAEDHSNGNAPSPAELVQALALAGKIGPISSV